jgi:hypothetical protein
LAVIVRLASDRRCMKQWCSSRLAVAWGWAAVALMGVATLGMFYFMATGH